MAKRSRNPAKDEGEAGSDKKSARRGMPRENKEDLAYYVASLVCEKGWAASTIARKIFPEYFTGRKRQSHAIMRVKRALQYATQRGILKLTPPLHEELQDKLKRRYDWIRQFTVVHDEPVMQASTDDDSVFRVAAREIGKEIQRLLANKPNGDIVVGNAGGLTLSRVVRCLPTEAVIPEDAMRIRFISLNAARMPDFDQISSGFLAVRMSEIYGARHLTVLPGASRRNRVGIQYEEALKGIDLMITSAGTRSGFLFRWHEEEYGTAEEYRVSDDIIGDIAFIPLDEEGNKVELPPAFRDHVEQELKPRPLYEDLMSLANRGQVLVVCARLTSDPDPHHRAAEYGSLARARTTRAILERGLASKCILGTSVACGVLDA